MAIIEITLDVTKPQETIEKIEGRQGDTATIVRATILNDGEPYEFSSGKYLELALVRPDGAWVHLREHVVQHDGNVWDATLPAQATAADGLCKLCYFVVRDEADANHRESTQRFLVDLDESATAEAHLGPYSDQVDKLVAEAEAVITAWEAERARQRAAFEAEQAARAEEFAAAQRARAADFIAAQEARTEAFNATLDDCEKQFTASESARQEAYDVAEAARQTVSEAAVTRANNAAKRVEDAVTGELDPLFKGWIDEQKNTTGGLVGYDKYLQEMVVADEVTLHKSGTSLSIANGGVTTSKLSDKSVTTGKLADTAVTEAKITNGAVTTGKIADNSVTVQKLSDLRKIRSEMGLGDTLGVLPVECGGTGGTNGPLLSNYCIDMLRDRTSKIGFTCKPIELPKSDSLVWRFTSPIIKNGKIYLLGVNKSYYSTTFELRIISVDESGVVEELATKQGLSSSKGGSIAIASRRKADDAIHWTVIEYGNQGDDSSSGSRACHYQPIEVVLQDGVMSCDASIHSFTHPGNYYISGECTLDCGAWDESDGSRYDLFGLRYGNDGYHRCPVKMTSDRVVSTGTTKLLVKPLEMRLLGYDTGGTVMFSGTYRDKPVFVSLNKTTLGMSEAETGLVLDSKMYYGIRQEKYSYKHTAGVGTLEVEATNGIAEPSKNVVPPGFNALWMYDIADGSYPAISFDFNYGYENMKAIAVTGTSDYVIVTDAYGIGIAKAFSITESIKDVLIDIEPVMSGGSFSRVLCDSNGVVIATVKVF